MGFPDMAIVRMGLRSDSVKRFLNKLSYNEIFKMNSSVWRDIRSRNGSQSGIVGLREGNRVWRVSPDIYPPFKGVTTRHYLLWNGVESHVCQGTVIPNRLTLQQAQYIRTTPLLHSPTLLLIISCTSSASFRSSSCPCDVHGPYLRSTRSSYLHGRYILTPISVLALYSQTIPALVVYR